MESKVKYLYDDALKLKAVGSVAITASGVSSQVGLNLITAGRGDVNNRFGEGSFDIVFHVVAIDHTTGDETYSVAVKTYDSAGANGTLQETIALVVGDLATTKVWKFDTVTLQQTHAAAANIGLDITLAGTTPILQYWAFVAPNRRFG